MEKKISIVEQSYEAIPKCFGLLNTQNLMVSGIIQMQGESTLSLTGQGVFVAILDTGINADLAVFRRADGRNVVEAIWDQETNRIYEEQEILENPPRLDDNGHGTALAGIMCGQPDVEADFVGGLFDASLCVVKLRQAKEDVRAYYFIPRETVAYEDTAIIEGIAWAEEQAKKKGRPLVLLLALGSNQGDHAGTGRLQSALNAIAVLPGHAVVTAAGNEAVARHHYGGRASSLVSMERIEISVPQATEGFYFEFWAEAPERFALQIQSPTGELSPEAQGKSNEHIEHRFLYEGTMLEIDVRDVGKETRNQLIYVRFTDVPSGIWTILVSPVYLVTGNFHIWLPMQNMLSRDVVFLEPNPQVTLTTPSDAKFVITVGSYNGSTGANVATSGRGYSMTGQVKPDFVAPGVDVTAPGTRDFFTQISGSSAAAALGASAAGQVLEWAVFQQNAGETNSIDIRNFLIRGTTKREGETYPNPIWGYGAVNVEESFEIYRKL